MSKFVNFETRELNVDVFLKKSDFIPKGNIFECKMQKFHATEAKE